MSRVYNQIIDNVNYNLIKGLKNLSPNETTTNDEEDKDHQTLFSKINDKLVETVEKLNFSNVDSVWNEAGVIFDYFIKETVIQVLPVALDIAYDSNVSEICSTSLLQTLQGIKEQKSWAIRMIDSTSKYPSGVLDGSITSLGAFDECLRVKVDEGPNFIGKYCLLTMKPVLPKQPKEILIKTRVVNLTAVQSE
ncbi:nose resistant to fluoxetine protein 6-like protein, partial [Leptotrombidium deliense]